MSAALYSLEVLRLAASLSRYPLLASPDARAERRSALCGSRVTVDLAFDADGRVHACGVDARACAMGQASAALLVAHATGRSAAELNEALATLTAFLSGAMDTSGDWPGLDLFAAARAYPARHAAIRLPFEAAVAAAEVNAATRLSA